MKELKRICLVVFLVAVVFVATACGKKGGIVGKWTYETGSYTYTFNEDGTGDYNGRKFTYTTEGEKLSILSDGDTAPFETTYTIDGDKLNVRDSFGNDLIYIRK